MQKVLILFIVSMVTPSFAKDNLSNHTLHEVRRNFREKSDAYRKCDDNEWPETDECMRWALAGVRVIRDVDQKFSGR